MNHHITHDRCGESLTPADLAQNFNYNVGAALTEAWKAGADEAARRPLERAVEHLTRELERRKYEASRADEAPPSASIGTVVGVNEDADGVTVIIRPNTGRRADWLAEAVSNKITVTEDEELAEPPAPALPTEPGTVIHCTLDAEQAVKTTATMIRDGFGCWRGPDLSGESRYVNDSDRITDWTVVYDPTAPKADDNGLRERLEALATEWQNDFGPAPSFARELRAALTETDPS